MDAEQERMRALSSPLRMQILRLCREPHTNKELAEFFDINPGTMLHHVRTLTRTGFLEAQDARAGAQGAREVPYVATGLSWNIPLPHGSKLLVDVFAQQIAQRKQDDYLSSTWLGLRLSSEHRDELARRLHELASEFKERGDDPDGEPYSLFAAFHLDRTRLPRG